VQVDFPILGSAEGAPSRNCQVEVWVPPPVRGLPAETWWVWFRRRRGGSTGRASPVRLEMSAREADAAVFGYPADPPRPEGAWAACRLRGQVGSGMIQLDPRDAATFRAQPGYSGSPVAIASENAGMPWSACWP
jgi:hypothetical protein